MTVSSDVSGLGVRSAVKAKLYSMANSEVLSWNRCTASVKGSPTRVSKGTHVQADRSSYVVRRHHLARFERMTRCRSIPSRLRRCRWYVPF